MIPAPTMRMVEIKPVLAFKTIPADFDAEVDAAAAAAVPEAEAAAFADPISLLVSINFKDECSSVY